MRILYVAGYGRSGSTTLGNVWAAEQGCQHLGEVARVADFGFWERCRCACGEVTPCRFWQRVLDALATTEGVEVSQRLKWLQGWAGMLVPRFLLVRWVDRIPAGPSFPDHSLVQLVGAMLDTAEGTMVDSSKTAWGLANRPRALAAAGFDVEVRIAWRPFRQVLRSHQEAGRRRGLRRGAGAAVKLVVSRSSALLAASIQSRAVGGRPSRWPLEQSIALWHEQGQPMTHHTIAGNRQRLTGEGMHEDDG